MEDDRVQPEELPAATGYARAEDIRFGSGFGVVTHMALYGPPRSWRGRLMNRIRRLLRREERNELFWHGAILPIDDMRDD